MLVRVNHDSHVMTAQEQKYWEHALSGDPMIKDFLMKQGMHGVDFREKAMNQPICPKCERFCFHHKTGIACPSCGYMGAEKTHKIKIHLKDGHFR